MPRGRKPQGDHALSNAERQQRWRQREKQSRSELEWSRNLRRRIANAVTAWADQNPQVENWQAAIHEAFENYENMLYAMTIPDPQRGHPYEFVVRYIKGETFPSPLDALIEQAAEARLPP
jgi:hypothetical protein